jgi:hypothetical protein
MTVVFFFFISDFPGKFLYQKLMVFGKWHKEWFQLDDILEFLMKKFKTK